MNKNIYICSKPITAVINFEKDWLKDHWRVNVIKIES